MTPPPDDMHEAVEVTVVIPTRNRRELLLRAVRSALRQQGVATSVVVVDEASTDGSAEALDLLLDPQVRVVRHATPRGVARARNTGLEHVSTPWVAFLDDDDLWAPDKLSAQLEALRRHPSAQWACTGAVLIDSEYRILGLSHPPPPGADIADLMLTSNAVPGGGSGVLASTALARQIGGFDEALAVLADWDFYTRLSLRSPLAGAPGPLVAYYVHPDGMAHDIERSRREFGYLDLKYAGERRARDVSLAQGAWLHNLAGLARRRGQRWLSAQLALQAAAHGRLGALRRVVGAALPESVRAARERRAVDQIPADLVQEARAWLAAYAYAG